VGWGIWQRMLKMENVEAKISATRIELWVWENQGDD